MDIEIWSNKFDSCINCKTVDFEHKANGYCKYCYPLIKRREVVEKWDQQNTTSIKEIAGINKEFIALALKDDFGSFKANIIKQINLRLSLFEDFNKENVTDMDIEIAFKKIEKVIFNNDNNSIYHACRSSFDQLFNNEQRKIIYHFLLKLLIKKRFQFNLYDLT